MIPTTLHKSASSSIHWGRFCLLSSFFHFHPLFSLCSFEPHHSFPFSVFPFRPHTLSIIPPSLCLLPPAAQLHISVLPHHLALFPQLPSSTCFKMETLSLHFFFLEGGGFKKRFSLPHSLVPLALCFSALVRPSVFPRPGRVMNVLFYGESPVHPLPPSEPPINQRPGIQLATGARRNVLFLSCPPILSPSLFHLWPRRLL